MQGFQVTDKRFNVCDKCPRRAVIYQRYSGMRLCQEHFERDVERKVREALRQTGLFGGRVRLAIGLDGGRRSAVLAYILQSLFSRRRDLEFLAIIIDLGEDEGCRAREAQLVAERLKMPFVVRSLPSRTGEPGSFGLHQLKHELIFSVALELDAGVVATGEDLDDVALEIFIRYLTGDVAEDLGRSGGGVQCKKNISWIKPLARIPKREVRLYAIGRDLGNPENRNARDDLLCSKARRLLSDFDGRHPGTCYSLLRGWQRGQHQFQFGLKGAKPLSKDMK